MPCQPDHCTRCWKRISMASAAGTTGKCHGTTTRPTRSGSSALSSAWGNGMKRTSCWIFSYPTAVRSNGTNGRKSVGAIRGHPVIWETCHTHGSRRNTCWHWLQWWPASAITRPRWFSRPDCHGHGFPRKTESACKDCQPNSASWISIFPPAIRKASWSMSAGR